MAKHARIDVLTVAPENQEKLFSLVQHIATHLENVDECLYFIVSKDKDNPSTVWVTELWTSEEDHDNSLKDIPDDLRTILDEVMSLVIDADTRQRAKLIPTVSKGIANP